MMSKKITVLTGAGISTAAGIPDFRGPQGIWTLHPEQMKVYDFNSFIHDKEAREYSWKWQKDSPVWKAQPGSAHYALVDLEKAHLLSGIATQNFDGLHEKAGSSPDLIVNLHGTIQTSHCLKCHAPYATSSIMSQLDSNPDPHCSQFISSDHTLLHKELPLNAKSSQNESLHSLDKTANKKCNGILKTDVIYFGEPLPDGSLERSIEFLEHSAELWVIGSTLEVFPAASLVPIAFQMGLSITIINKGETQFDNLASTLISEPIEESVPRLVKERIKMHQDR